ncbi:MAG: isochorismatase family cysteine hydrolase [Anaerolineaceae bacterium]|nr:isochorismatase family cysteine hydrolase [Anaerolineaceae bacterium]
MSKNTQIKALLILDPQNDFFGKDNPNLSTFQATIPIINAAIATFREQHWPIIFIQHTSKRKPEGSENWKIHPQFNHHSDDICLNKTHYSAFWKTDLETTLKEKQVDSVIVCGYMAEYCVLSTLRGAAERGFDAVILKDSIASLEDRFTQFTLEISPMIRTDQLK